MVWAHFFAVRHERWYCTGIVTRYSSGTPALRSTANRSVQVKSHRSPMSGRIVRVTRCPSTSREIAAHSPASSGFATAWRLYVTETGTSASSSSVTVIVRPASRKVRKYRVSIGYAAVRSARTCDTPFFSPQSTIRPMACTSRYGCPSPSMRTAFAAMVWFVYCIWCAVPYSLPKYPDGVRNALPR